MITNFDINSLFKNVFGIGRGEPYAASEVRQPVQAAIYADYLPDEVKGVKKGEGGVFINMRDTVKASTPTGQRIFMPMRLGGVLLPNEPTISITGTQEDCRNLIGWQYPKRYGQGTDFDG